jgi:peptidoglycan/xylan/chitin deacetylase (PgdA/CDA1 family)
MIPKRSLWLMCMMCCTFMALPVGSLSSEGPVVVNVMIDAELSPFTHNETLQERGGVDATSLDWMLSEIERNKLNATVYVTGDFASSNPSYIEQAESKSNHEIALHGMTTAENITDWPYQRGFTLIDRARSIVQAAWAPRSNEKCIKGFRPQGFNQSDAVLDVLEDLGFTYDSGYMAGLLFLPGDENDTWPYSMEGHRLYAVPVSTHWVSGSLIHMCDVLSVDLKFTGAQWYDILVQEFEECASRGDPMVVIFHNFISGEDDEYKGTYTNFISYAMERNATFVTTMDLVKRARERIKAS